MFCSCLCCSSCACDSASSARLIRSIGEFGTKNYFTDHQAANAKHTFRDSFSVLKIHCRY